MSVYLVGFSCPFTSECIGRQGRKKMFYLTTLEENVLFNDAPNTFIWRRVYGKGPLHGLLFPIHRKIYFI